MQFLFGGYINLQILLSTHKEEILLKPKWSSIFMISSTWVHRYFPATYFANLKFRTWQAKPHDMIFNILQMFPKTPCHAQQDTCLLMNKC